MITLCYTRQGDHVRVFRPQDPARFVGVENPLAAIHLNHLRDVDPEASFFCSPYTLTRIASRVLGLTQDEVTAQGVRLLHPGGTVATEHPPTVIPD